MDEQYSVLSAKKEELEKERNEKTWKRLKNAGTFFVGGAFSAASGLESIADDQTFIAGVLGIITVSALGICAYELKKAYDSYTTEINPIRMYYR